MSYTFDSILRWFRISFIEADKPAATAIDRLFHHCSLLKNTQAEWIEVETLSKMFTGDFSNCGNGRSWSTVRSDRGAQSAAGLSSEINRIDVIGCISSSTGNTIIQ